MSHSGKKPAGYRKQEGIYKSRANKKRSGHRKYATSPKTQGHDGGDRIVNPQHMHRENNSSQSQQTRYPDVQHAFHNLRSFQRLDLPSFLPASTATLLHKLRE